MFCFFRNLKAKVVHLYKDLPNLGSFFDFVSHNDKSGCVLPFDNSGNVYVSTKNGFNQSLQVSPLTQVISLHGKPTGFGSNRSGLFQPTKLLNT